MNSHFRHDVEVASQVRNAAPKAPSVFYATPTDIPKTHQFGVSIIMVRKVGVDYARVKFSYICNN